MIDHGTAGYWEAMCMKQCSVIEELAAMNRELLEELSQYRSVDETDELLRELVKGYGDSL